MMNMHDFAATGVIYWVEREECEALFLEAGLRGAELEGVGAGEGGEGAAEEGVHGWTAGLVDLALGGDACYCWSRTSTCRKPGVRALVVACCGVDSTWVGIGCVNVF